MAEFKAGDVVQLKSGGPKMTVAKVEEWNGTMRAQCDWFEGTKTQTGYFPLTSLEIYAAPARAQAGGKGGAWS